jgi:hypothetical protein
MTRAQIAGGVVTVAVTAAIGWGIFVVGSPADERSRRLDQRRVQDLIGVAQAVDVFWTRRASLPASLQAVRDEVGVQVTITDPGTNAPYEFRVLAENRYELCAVFEGESAEAAGVRTADFWSHRSGRQCFQRDARAVR